MKKNKYKELTSNTLLFSLSTFGAKFISFILLPLYTYILTTEEYGTAELITTTVAILLPVLTINIQDAVLRFCLDKHSDSDDVLNVAIDIVIASTVILGILLVFLSLFNFTSLNNLHIFFIFIIYVANAFYNVISVYLQAVNKVVIFAIGGILNTLITCILNIVLLVGVKLGLTGYLISYVGGTIVAIIYMVFSSKLYERKIFTVINWSLGRDLIKYSAPLVFNSLAWWINTASDRYILTIFCGASITGIYSVAYKIPTILSTIQSVFYNAWSISAIKEFDKDDGDGFISKVFILYIALSISCCSLLLILNIPIAKILYSKDFFAAWKYVPFLLYGAVFNGLALFEGCLFSAVKKTKTISVTTIIGAAVNTGLNFGLIPIIGATGAAIATMIGYVVIFSSRLLMLKSIVNLHVKWKKTLICFVVLLIQSVAATFVDKTLIQILVQIFFTGLIFILLRKDIQYIFDLALKKIKRKFNP